MNINNIDRISKKEGVTNVIKLTNSSGVTATSAETYQPSKAELEVAVKKLNAMMSQSNTSIEFSLDASNSLPVIKVIDIETKMVLRQLPNLEALAFSRNLDSFKGLLLNQKV